MKLWQKVAIWGTLATGVAGSAVYINGCNHKEQKQTTNTAKAPEKKVEDVMIPEQPKVVPKEEPKVEPKVEPKPEVPKWEAKAIVFESSVKYENPVTYAIAMEQWRVEVGYRKVIGEAVKETALARIHRYSQASGEDNIVQRAELKTGDLEAKVEDRRKKDNKPYEELNMGSLSISDKTEEKARIPIMPENEAQEKRLLALKETYKSPKQAEYLAFALELNSADQKISDEKLTYVENKSAEKYGGKK